jgi:hypothetical protein
MPGRLPFFIEVTIGIVPGGHPITLSYLGLKNNTCKVTVRHFFSILIGT